MTIDWFTFTAQIVNFLLLVGLLRWLLYGPIIRAMNEREERIAERLGQADRRLSDAEEVIGQYEEKQRQLDQKREQMVRQARQDAHEEHDRLVRQAKDEVQHKRSQWEEALQREQSDLINELQQQAGLMGLRAARRALSELADTQLESKICDAFAERIESIEQDQRQEVRKHLDDGSALVCVRSGFTLPEGQAQRFRNLIGATFETNAEVTFEQAPELISGVELDAGGYRFGWTVNDFLDDLKVDFSERLRTQI